MASVFFTFQQIAYLADLKRGNARVYRFREFAAYLMYFPHLIAGPIVRHDELVAQFALDPKREGMAERLSRGLILLSIGSGQEAADRRPRPGQWSIHCFRQLRSFRTAGAWERRFRLHLTNLFRFLGILRYGNRHCTNVWLYIPDQFQRTLSRPPPFAISGVAGI